MLNVRARALRVALGFAGSKAVVRPVPLGTAQVAGLGAAIGRIAVGMAHQGFDLQLTCYDERGWRAPFYVTRGTRADTDD